MACASSALQILMTSCLTAARSTGKVTAILRENAMHKADLIITKRMLGALLIALGALAFAGILLLDALRGTFGDFGTAQLLGLAGSLGVCLVGLSLLPLGDRPA